MFIRQSSLFALVLACLAAAVLSPSPAAADGWDFGLRTGLYILAVGLRF